MFPFIKICGVQSQAEAKLCVSAGVTAVGCLVGLTHKAEDKVTPDVAAGIFASLPKEVLSVLVTHLTEVDDLVEYANLTKPRAIQVHGDASLQTVERLASRLPNVVLIKAVHVLDQGAVEVAREWDNAPISAILLDSRTADRLGGTGQTHDWGISAAIVRASKHPVILAGGLSPANVGDAIRAVCPKGVDTNSGVEVVGGAKDPLKVRAFVQTARDEFARCDSVGDVCQPPNTAK